MLACSKSSKQPQKPAPFAENYIAAGARKPMPIAHSKHALISFKQSKCKSTESMSEKILHKELRSDTLIVKVRGNQNCDTQYKSEFNFTDDHLNLSTSQLPHIIKLRNGQTDTLYSTYQCNCVYEFTYTISHVHILPQAITFNGKIIN
jgi:hypothetical protein